MENIETWKTNLMGEVLLFGLLGRILYQEPDKEWLDGLIADDVFSEIPFGSGQTKVEKGLKTLQQWTKKNIKGITDKEFELIKRDHLYLFTGVGKPLAPVWESIYLSDSHSLFQKETLQVRQWFARFGLQVEKLNREPDDHIGLELSFMSHLAARALQALESGNEQDFEPALQAQRDFMTQHPLRWAPTWSKLVNQNATSDFYHGIAYLTLGGLIKTTELLSIQMPEAVSL